MFYHHAFNLKIQSELFFPELLESTPAECLPSDVHIHYGNVSPIGLERPSSQFLYLQFTAKTLWLHVPHVARFLISDGREIIIDPIENCDEDSIRVFLLGSCMGAILIQRNIFLLHSNAVRVGDHCISIAGRSGAGKSTLSAAFFVRGYEVLADDVCAINQDCQVIPSFPQMKLWIDSAKHLNIDTELLRRIRPNVEKFAVPLGGQFYREHLPLKTIFILQSHNQDKILFEPVRGLQKIVALKANTYRPSYHKNLGLEGAYYRFYSKIASQTEVVRITRPMHGFKLDELVSKIQELISSRSLLNAI